MSNFEISTKWSISLVDLVGKMFSIKTCHIKVLSILIIEWAALIWILKWFSGTYLPSYTWQVPTFDNLIAPSKNWNRQKFYATKFIAKMFYNIVHFQNRWFVKFFIQKKTLKKFFSQIADFSSGPWSKPFLQQILLHRIFAYLSFLKELLKFRCALPLQLSRWEKLSYDKFY